eukprot:1203344-Alexandrium_andersonii.AAC.1
MASGVRSLNCAAPRTTLKLGPRALKECIMRRFESRARWRRRVAHPGGREAPSKERFGPELGGEVDWTSLCL